MLDETKALEDLFPANREERTQLTKNESILIGQVFKRDRLLSEILAVLKSARHLEQPQNILDWFDRTGEKKITELWDEGGDLV